jgi:hypothetical protein
MSHKTQALQSIKDNYNDLLTEYFFLSVSLHCLCLVTGVIVNFDRQTGGNIMDFQFFCKRPTTNFYEFSKVHRLDEAEAVKEQARPTPDVKSSPAPAQLAVLSNLHQYFFV